MSGIPSAPVGRILPLLAALVARLTPTKTVDSAIAFVTKALTALEAAERAQSDEASRLFAKADAAEKRAQQLNSEGSARVAAATRAARIRGNLAQLAQ